MSDSYELISRMALSGNAVGRPPTFSEPVSQVCGYEQFLHPDFLRWVREMGMTFKPHRKLWENAFIAQAANRRGILNEGNAAIGFGCGQEPLPSLFAKYGVEVLASDQPIQGTAGIWAETGQHAASLEAIFHSRIVSRELFDAKVRFRPIDMLQLPEDLGLVDLVWSACTIEHLGSPELGLDFVRRSLDLLRPGGVAVHTTELDLIERDSSLDLGHCAVYQTSQIQDFLRSLDHEDFESAINLWVPMDHPPDRMISIPPYSADEPHLKLVLGPTITTSVGIVVKRRAASSGL